MFGSCFFVVFVLVGLDDKGRDVEGKVVVEYILVVIVFERFLMLVFVLILF